MNEVWMAFALTTMAGLSTGIGSAIAYVLRKPKLSYLSILLGFSAGVMIYISFVELLRSSMEEIGFLPGNLAFFAGVAAIFLVDKLVPHMHLDVRKDTKRGSLEQAGIMTAIGIAIHNFPEGMAVLAVSLASPRLGLPVAMAIAIHNIPEGISVSVPIFYATGDRRRAFLYSFFSGVSEPAGAVIGYLVLQSVITSALLAGTLAFVGGIMVFICFDELIPIANRYGDYHLGIYGLFLGMIVMMVSLTGL